MAAHGESYLCLVCNAIVPLTYRWAGSQVEANCSRCGKRVRAVRPTPDVLARVGPKPDRKPAGDLFGEGVSCGD